MSKKIFLVAPDYFEEYEPYAAFEKHKDALNHIKAIYAASDHEGDLDVQEIVLFAKGEYPNSWNFTRSEAQVDKNGILVLRNQWSQVYWEYHDNVPHEEDALEEVDTMQNGNTYILVTGVNQAAVVKLMTKTIEQVIEEIRVSNSTRV